MYSRAICHDTVLFLHVARASAAWVAEAAGAPWMPRHGALAARNTPKLGKLALLLAFPQICSLSHACLIEGKTSQKPKCSKTRQVGCFLVAERCLRRNSWNKRHRDKGYLPSRPLTSDAQQPSCLYMISMRSGDLIPTLGPGVCVCVCVYIYIHVNIHIHMHTHIYIYIYVHTHIINIHIYIYTYTYTPIIYIYIHVKIYVYIYTYVHVCTVALRSCFHGAQCLLGAVKPSCGAGRSQGITEDRSLPGVPLKGVLGIL